MFEESKEEREVVGVLCKHCGNLINDKNSTNPCLKCGETERIPVFSMDAVNNEIARNIILLVGPTGSGKNYLHEKLKELNYVNVPSITTRDLWNGEIEGDDYIKVTNDEFTTMLNNNTFCEYVNFGPAKYGVSIRVLVDLLWNTNHNLVIIVEPNGYEQMLKWFASYPQFIQPLNLKIIRVFLNISRSERFINLLKDIPAIRFKYSLQQAFENTIHDGNAINADESYDLEIFKGHLETILARLVRNGDSIASDFSEVDIRCQHYILKIMGNKIPIFLNIIRSKSDMDDFILSVKKENFEIDKLLEEIDAIEDKSVLQDLVRIINRRYGDINGCSEK